MVSAVSKSFSISGNSHSGMGQGATWKADQQVWVKIVSVNSHKKRRELEEDQMALC